MDKPAFIKTSIDTLLDYRNNWSDEIPSEIVNSSHAPNNKYKVRGAWFTIVMSRLDSLDYLELLSPELSSKIEKWGVDIEQKFHNHYPYYTKKSDIQYANKLIDEVIYYLDGQK